MSDATDPRHELRTDPLDGALGQRLGALGRVAAAPPAPTTVIGVVRARRRRRRAAWSAGRAGVVAIVVGAAVTLRPAPPPLDAALEGSPRWVHLTGAEMPSAARLRHVWLQTGDLPTSPAAATEPAAPTLRPLDALDAMGLDPIG